MLVGCYREDTGNLCNQAELLLSTSEKTTARLLLLSILLMITESLLRDLVVHSQESSTLSEDWPLPASSCPASSVEADQEPSRNNHYLQVANQYVYSKAAKTFDLTGKWNATAEAKKFALRAKRAALTDLDRFKVMISRKNRSFKLRQLAKKTLKKWMSSNIAHY